MREAAASVSSIAALRARGLPAAPFATSAAACTNRASEACTMSSQIAVHAFHDTYAVCAVAKTVARKP
jgi:hypothetical protein